MGIFAPSLLGPPPAVAMRLRPLRIRRSSWPCCPLSLWILATPGQSLEFTPIVTFRWPRSRSTKMGTVTSCDMFKSTAVMSRILLREGRRLASHLLNVPAAWCYLRRMAPSDSRPVLPQNSPRAWSFDEAPVGPPRVRARYRGVRMLRSKGNHRRAATSASLLCLL